MVAVAIGIDLGTTNICFGYYTNKHVQLIPDEYGNHLIPSVVTFTETDILVGLPAQDEYHMYPKTCIFEVKRLIGQKFNSKEVQKDINRFPYLVVNESGCLKIDVGKETLLPETICSYMLKYILELADKALRKKITVAVITVPAYFGLDQREATKAAAKSAGFESVFIINEPTAAAVAYQTANIKKYKRTLLVYDFGGGTFDVSIVRAKGSNVDVLAVDGDCHLGGTDIDFNLCEYVKQDIKDKYGVNLEDNRVNTRLKHNCKSCKEQLSRVKRVNIELSNIHPDIPWYKLTIFREIFDDINNDLFNKTLEIIKRCISSAKLTKSDIDVVIQVGGSSRIPKIQQILGEYFGYEKLFNNENPDYLVAHGAAIYANCIMTSKSEITFGDVLSHTLGIKCINDVFSTILKRNVPLPFQNTKRYYTVHDYQTKGSLDVYEGENPKASENILVRRYRINILTKALAGKVGVDVTFSLNNEGILKIDANEVGVNNKNTIYIDMSETYKEPHKFAVSKTQ